MPPAYINVGAYVDEGTMVDSHALVGSLRADRQTRSSFRRGTDRRRARTGRMPMPVIIEDDVLVGGNTGVYEGTIVRERAVLA